MTDTFCSRQLGPIEYTPDSVVEFPEGIPAFELETRFLLIERPESAPLIFLQSLGNADLCFAALPVGCVDQGYQLKLDKSDLEILGIDTPGERDILCLAILTVPREGEATANLMAPVVIHRMARRARQVIQFESGHSFRHALPVEQPVRAVEEEDQQC